MKNLENYFIQDVQLPDASSPIPGLTGSEKAFLEKYVGTGWESTPTADALTSPVHAEQASVLLEQGADQPQEPEADLETALMAEEELRLVSFHVADQLFAVPIMLVQEVLRAVPVTKLPAAPQFLVGVTNLRGRVTPIVDLATMLEVRRTDDSQDGFLIVCRLGDMQIGLAVRAIDTMYKAPRGDIEWGIESTVGVNADLMAGLLKAQDRLIKILSVNRLFQKVLKS